MPEIVKIKAFCIERYKNAQNLKGNEVLRIFKQYGFMDYISFSYDVLHTFWDKYIRERLTHECKRWYEL